MKDIPQGFFFRASDHSYFLNGKRMTGVTTILNVLSKPALIGWAANMAVDYVKEHSGFRLETVENLSDGTPEEQVRYYTIYPETLEEARTAYAKHRDKRAEEGSDLHALVETYIKECIEKTSGVPALKTEEASIKPFIEWAQKEDIKFLASEARFYSESLYVAGTADLIFEKDGKRYVGDVKNKKKIWSREPFYQCAAYGMLAEEMGEKPFDGYCVIKLWNDEVEALWSFDVEGDREAFKACITLYRSLANFN